MYTDDTLRARLVLIGAPGAGKTKLGKRIARLIDSPFIDTDKLIVAEHGVIKDIFEQRGEPYFRDVEREAVRVSLRSNSIVALGGGAVLNIDTQMELKKLLVVQLTVSADAVEKRIVGGKRPLLKDGISAWAALVEARLPLYAQLADRSWDTSEMPLSVIAHEVAGWMKTLDSRRIHNEPTAARDKEQET